MNASKHRADVKQMSSN